MDVRRTAQLTRELGGDRDLAERLVEARRELVRAVPDQVARTHLTAVLAACSEPSRGDGEQVTLARRAARVVAVAAALTLVTAGGLAIAGSLPMAAQDLVAEAVSHIGVDLPRPEVVAPDDPPSGPPPPVDEAPAGSSGDPATERHGTSADPEEPGPRPGAGTERREPDAGPEPRDPDLDPVPGPRDRPPGEEVVRERPAPGPTDPGTPERAGAGTHENPAPATGRVPPTPRFETPPEPPGPPTPAEPSRGEPPTPERSDRRPDGPRADG